MPNKVVPQIRLTQFNLTSKHNTYRRIGMTVTDRDGFGQQNKTVRPVKYAQRPVSMFL